MQSVLRWIKRLQLRGNHAAVPPAFPSSEIGFDTAIRAQGQVLALIAILLERQRIVTAPEFARRLQDFADVTVADHPEEGRILALWAGYLREAATSMHEPPSLQ